MTGDSLLTDKQFERLERRIRILLSDFADANQLTGEELFSRDRIEMAVEDALDDWNNTPPPLAPITFTTHPTQSLLHRRIIIELLRHEHLMLTRNGIDFSDGGAAIADSQKANSLLQLISTINAEYQHAKRSKKVEINIASGWGSVPSDYANIGYGYGYNC